MKTYRSDVIKCLIWDLQEILERHTNRSSIICSYLEHFPVSALKIFPQKIYDIFSCAALKKCIIFSQKNFSNFQETEFFIFRESIFKTLVYLELERYSEPKTYWEHCQMSTMEYFAKIATLCTFQPKFEK